MCFQYIYSIQYYISSLNLNLPEINIEFDLILDLKINIRIVITSIMLVIAFGGIYCSFFCKYKTKDYSWIKEKSNLIESSIEIESLFYPTKR